MRSGVDLSGPWHYSIDPFRSGLAGFHGETPDRGQQRYREADVRKEMAADNRILYEFDLANSPVTTLPSSWLTEAPELRYYQGLMWYQRRFPVPAARTGRYFLRFGAANYATVLYVNGQPVGRHEGGFTPFAFEVTRLLRDGDNQITVGVDSQATATTVPPTVTDWENYGGITRPVRLINTPDTYVDDAWVRLTRDGRLAVDAHLDGPGAANRPVHLRIAELGLDIAGTTDGKGDWRTTMAAPRALVRWSPDRPRLYDVRIDAGEDQWRDRIGFRTIEVRGTDILLNGKPIFLRGISLHEEELGNAPTRAMTPAAARALLSEIKDGLHGNYSAPRPLSAQRGDDADGRRARHPRLERSAGLLARRLVQSRHAGDGAQHGRGEYPARSQPGVDRDLERRQRNPGQRRAQQLPAHAGRRRARARRYAAGQRRAAGRTFAGKPWPGHDDGRSAGGCARYRRDQHLQRVVHADRLADLADFTWQVPADKPLVFSEFGADARAGFHDLAGPQKFSEEYQADFYRATLAMVDKLPTMRGMSPWILKDFRSPRRQNPDFQQGWNRKGLISETGQHKLAFDVLAQYYRGREIGSKR